MLTIKAIELADKARESKGHAAELACSIIAFRELIDNCQPTREEFVEFSNGLILNSGALWDLALKIPEWNNRGGGQQTQPQNRQQPQNEAQ